MLIKTLNFIPKSWTRNQKVSVLNDLITERIFVLQFLELNPLKVFLLSFNKHYKKKKKQSNTLEIKKKSLFILLTPFF